MNPYLSWFFITKMMMTGKSRHNNRWQTQIVSEPAGTLESFGPGIHWRALVAGRHGEELKEGRDDIDVTKFVNT